MTTIGLTAPPEQIDLLADQAVSFEAADLPYEFEEVLAHLLRTEDFPYTKDDFTKRECDNWTDANYVAYGRWLAQLIEKNGQPQRPTVKIYQRAYTLGLGPDVGRVYRRFGTFWQFNNEIGVGGGYSRGRFDSWSTRDFLDYGQNLSAVLENKPTIEDLQRCFLAGKGPSPVLVKQRFGSLGNYYELLGFPNVRKWGREDYIDWGVRVVRANPGKVITRYVIDELSAKRRGPSTRSIYNYFGALSKFQAIIEQESALRAESEAAELQAKSERYQGQIAAGKLPDFLLEAASNDNQRFVRLCARRELVDALVPHLGSSERRDIAARSPKSIIEALERANPSLTAGEIEVKALLLGIFDDVWPPQENLDQLRSAA